MFVSNVEKISSTLMDFRNLQNIGLAELLKPQYRHDQLTRFLAQGVCDQHQYWRLIKPIVRQFEQGDGVIIVDDTIEKTPYTDENDIVCWHGDHTSRKIMCLQRCSPLSN